MPSSAMDLEAIEGYLLRGTYPADYSKDQKTNLRRRCRNNFRIHDGVLQYRKAIVTKADQRDEAESNGDSWRICVRSEDEKARVLECCHAGVGGIVDA